MSCYLFLDFDGVLHPEMCKKSAFFSQLPLLEAVLMHHPDTKVVVSSTWRHEHSLEGLRAFFSPDVAHMVVGSTPTVTRTDDEGWIPRELLMHHREWECRKWLRLNGVPDASWIAIDDADGWFTPGSENLILTSSDRGLQPEDATHLSHKLRTST